MPLFEIPGWSVSSAPVKEQSNKTSKKRKSIEDQGHVEKFLSSETESAGSNKKRKGEPSPAKQKSLFHPTKNGKRGTLDPKPTSDSTLASLTALQRNMKESLDGARFRFINETLYKSDSHEARSMMQQDPKMFDDYHTGFRHQVLSWPKNPVDLFIKKFSAYSPKTLIADLGCGDAILAKGLLPKGISVISFDLVSDDKFVVEADICERVPLPGSEGSLSKKSNGEGQIIDVVVCALSLMGTNWVMCLGEAWRILKAGGQLHIAEVTSRFVDVDQFNNLVESIGFRLKSRDVSNSHFMVLEFVKTGRHPKLNDAWEQLAAKGNVLKPCEYKRR